MPTDSLIVCPRRVLPWPSGVSRPTSPLGVASAEGRAESTAKFATGTTIQFATSAKLVETQISQFVSSFVNSFLQISQFVSSFVSSKIAFENENIEYRWRCIPFILLQFEQFELL